MKGDNSSVQLICPKGARGVITFAILNLKNKINNAT